MEGSKNSKAGSGEVYQSILSSGKILRDMEGLDSLLSRQTYKHFRYPTI